MICTSLCAPNTDEAMRHLRRAAELGTDLVELRLDLMPGVDWKALLRGKPCPVIVTVRSKAHGGAFGGEARSQADLLQQAADLGADYVDWEWDAAHPIDRKSSKLVLSCHTQEAVPADLDRLMLRAREIKADVVKVAATPRSSRDVIQLIERTSSWSLPRVVIPMGPMGEAVRVLYKRFGMAWTYAAIDKDHETAPGQITLDELVFLYRVGTIGDATRVFAVLGNPVAHSRSPEIFNAAFRMADRDAVYVRIPVDGSLSLREVMEFYRLSGASVTVPHKVQALSVCDEADSDSSDIGACNTLVARPNGRMAGRMRDGNIHGFNTDGPAAMDLLHDVSGKRILVLGAGGAARAIVAVLVRAGAHVAVFNRTHARAERLASDFQCEAMGAARIYDRSWDGVINATSVGMTPHEGDSPVEARLFKKGMIAMDVVYTPPRTKFLQDAERAGAVIIDGREMFLRQAALQWRHFMGQDVTEPVLREWRLSLRS